MYMYTEVKKSIYLSINLASFIMYVSFSSSSEQHQQYALCQYRYVIFLLTCHHVRQEKNHIQAINEEEAILMVMES